MMAAHAELVPTGRGKDAVWFDDVKYVFNARHEGPRKRKSYWRCGQICTDGVKCGAILHSNLEGTGDFELRKEHRSTCFVAVGSQEAAKAIAHIKDIVKDGFEGTSSVVSRVDASLSDAAALVVPLKINMSRTARRSRRKAQGIPIRQNTLATVQFSQLTAQHPGKPDETILQYDSGPQDAQRMIIFGSEASLDMLVDYDEWHGDGTFRCVSKMFSQMYSFHVNVNGKVFPAAIAVLVGKQQNLYERLLRQLIVLRPAIANKLSIAFMSDFEIAVRNAMKSVFPVVKQSFCFFHLKQSCWRKAQSLGLQRAYLADPELVTAIAMLPALCFVPPYLVNLAFCDIVNDSRYNDMIGRYPALVEYIAYFQKTYIGDHINRRVVTPPLFLVEEWNVYQRTLNGQPRTNNGVEGFHLVFNSHVNVSTPEMAMFTKHVRTIIVALDHERSRRFLHNVVGPSYADPSYVWSNQRILDGVRRLSHHYNFYAYCSNMSRSFKLH